MTGRPTETLRIGDDVTVLEIRDNQMGVDIHTPEPFIVRLEEIYQRIRHARCLARWA
jgi:sRNA-binding carbon storage regulator CsrA